MVDVENTKDETCQVQKHMALADVTVTIAHPIDVFLADCSDFAEHLFIAKQQQEQFQESLQNISEHELVEVMDFGQNYLCIYQDEAQGAHWHHSPVTIHPVVTYVKYPGPDRKETFREDIICISDDLKHDRHAVKVFEHAAIEHLQASRKICFHEKTQFTDGAAGQYKSANAFHDLAERSIDVTRNFWGEPSS